MKSLKFVTINKSYAIGGIVQDINIVREELSKYFHFVFVDGIPCRLEKKLSSATKRKMVKRIFRFVGKLLGSKCSYYACIHLEEVDAHLHKVSHINLFVPNLEYLLDHDFQLMSELDGVFTKTQEAKRLLEIEGISSEYIGFTSRDMYDSNVAKRYDAFAHFPGKSDNKGTSQLIQLWEKRPDWPRLHVYCYEDHDIHSFTSGEYTNVVIKNEYVSSVEFKKIFNSYIFHLCMSEVEGFGHYINEAMSVKSVVITVDAPPMNELVSEVDGFVVGYNETGSMGYACCYYFDLEALEVCIQNVLNTNADRLAGLQDHAREKYLERTEIFSQRFKTEVVDLLQS